MYWEEGVGQKTLYIIAAFFLRFRVDYIDYHSTFLLGCIGFISLHVWYDGMSPCCTQLCARR